MSAPLLACLVLVWVGAVGAGFKALWAYSTTPGESRVHPARWPADSALAHSTDHSTLVMFVHPRCSCTVASLSELRDILRSPNVAVSAQIVFLQPDAGDAGWAKTRTWDSAHRIPGVGVTADVNGREAGRFGAATSGQVLLYDAAGALTFAGGLTLIRGHEGDSPGRRSVLSLIQGRTPDRRSTPVYGCPLGDPE